MERKTETGMESGIAVVFRAGGLDRQFRVSFAEGNCGEIAVRFPIPNPQTPAPQYELALRLRSEEMGSMAERIPSGDPKLLPYSLIYIYKHIYSPKP